ncbi:MAG: hypothetical protein HY586_04375 [Candidatus Omnitrophica bacterium]|nr:hypothetical protein [Candidatus Omnitrophota bacterium]
MVLFVFIFGLSGISLAGKPAAPVPEAAPAAKQVAVDTNGDGKPDRWEYYESAELVRIEADTNSDGKIDELAKVEKGKIVSAEKDSNYDGKIDRWMQY